MTCCRTLGEQLPYWPDGRCDLDAPLAEDFPWTVYDVEGGTAVGPGGEGLYAEKVVGAVTISARMDGNQGGVNGRFAKPNPAVPEGSGGPGGGMPSGAADHNALTVLQNRVGGNSHANMQFSIDVPQPGFSVRVIDLDGPGQNNETLRTGGNPFGDDMGFGPYNLGQADEVISYKQGPGGNDNSQVEWRPGNGVPNAQGGPGYISVAGSEASAILIYRNKPWGDGTNGAPPISTGYVLSSGGGGRGSQYDFGGQIQQEVCTFTPRFARWVCCSGVRSLVDVTDGHTLTPAEAATIERRLTGVR